MEENKNEGSDKFDELSVVLFDISENNAVSQNYNLESVKSKSKRLKCG